MKINNKSSKKSLRITLIVLAALLMVAVLIYIFYPRSTSDSTIKQVKISEQSGKQTTSKDEKESAATNNSQNIDTSITTDEVPESATMSTSITLLEQKNDYVEYSASVTGATKATCSATFTSNLGKPVVRTSDATNGACSEKINATTFDALGEWQLQLRVYSENTQATDTKSFTIR